MRSALLILVALFALGCGASADVIVNDANYASLGWVAAIENGGATNPATIDFQPGIGTPPAGVGSLHLQTRYDDSDQLQKVYFGTNNYSGTALADITTLKVWTYLRYRDYPSVGLPPIMELIADSGTTAQQRRWWYVPNMSAVQFQTWQEWDLMASGTAQGQWMLMNTSSTNYKGDWAYLKARYGSGTAKIATPLVGDYTTPMSPSPDLRLSNQSGTSIAIKIGSGTCLYLNNYPAPLYQKAWWPECSGINAYVDKFVIGVRRPDGSIDEYTYDFDDPAASPLGTPVAMSNRAAAESIVTNESAKRPIVIYGKVGTYVGDYHPGLYFHVYDGSTKPDGSPAWVRIYSPGNTLPQPGEFSQFYVRAQGRLDNTGTTKTLYANPEDI